MHIGILSDPSNFHTLKWARNLCLAGAQVTVFSFDADQPEVQGLPIRFVQVPAAFAWKGNATYLSFLFSGKSLRKAVKAAGIQVLFPINVTPFGVWAVRSNTGLPIVQFAVGADILEFPPANEHNTPDLATRSWDSTLTPPSWISVILKKAKKALYRKQVAHALTRSHRIMADNQVLIEAIKNWFYIPKEKVFLNRGGVEPELFVRDENTMRQLSSRLGIPLNVPLLLSPRGMKPIYQGDIILDALAKVLEQGEKETHFLMLSAGYPVPAELEAKAEILKLRYPNFHYYTQMLSREEVYALWTITDIFISVPIYDGYSAALAEGRFVGAIPIVNDIPATRELLTHQQNAWIVPTFTSQALAAAITQVLKNKMALKQTFATENKTWIEQYSMMKDSAQKVIQWAEELCAT